MQNQPHRRPALKTLTVCDRPGGVTQLHWGRHWTFTAALGKCALEASSQCSVTHTKSMLTPLRSLQPEAGAGTQDGLPLSTYIPSFLQH